MLCSKHTFAQVRQHGYDEFSSVKRCKWWCNSKMFAAESYYLLLKKIVKDRNLALIVDELGADEGRDVLDIMAVLLDLDELSPQGNCVR